MKNYIGNSIAANYFRGFEAVGGKIEFDETGLAFESHAINIQAGKTKIGYSQIEKIIKRNTLGIVPNGISIFTKDNFEHKFVVNNRNSVLAFLQTKL